MRLTTTIMTRTLIELSSKTEISTSEGAEILHSNYYCTRTARRERRTLTFTAVIILILRTTLQEYMKEVTRTKVNSVFV